MPASYLSPSSGFSRGCSPQLLLPRARPEVEIRSPSTVSSLPATHCSATSTWPGSLKRRDVPRITPVGKHTSDVSLPANMSLPSFRPQPISHGLHHAREAAARKRTTAMSAHGGSGSPPMKDGSSMMEDFLAGDMDALQDHFSLAYKLRALEMRAKATLAKRAELRSRAGSKDAADEVTSLLTPEEVQWLELLALIEGFKSSQDMAETMARVHGRADPDKFLAEIAVASRMMADEVEEAAKTAMDGLSDGQDTAIAGGQARAGEDPAAALLDEFDTGTQQTLLYPSGPGLVCNEEVNAKHEEAHRLMEKIRKEKCSIILGGEAGTAFRSPFGPAVCGASLDDLTAVSLEQLHVHHQGVLSNSYVCLTALLPAVMAGCPTSVVADETGQHIRLALYGTGASSVAEAQELLPVGARFALKNPYLKRCNDGWLGLRVDVPETLVRLDLLPLLPGQRLLVLGDGDFSFSASLLTDKEEDTCARKRKTRRGSREKGAASVTATSLDSLEDVLRKYGSAADSLAHLAQDPNATVLHGVDATALAKSPGFCFDTVVWNFPYPPEGTQATSQELAGLLGSFFSCVDNVLDCNSGINGCGGQVWLTLAEEQGGSTREVAGRDKRVGIESLAAQFGFELIEVLPFEIARYAGYEPRRAFNDTSFPFNGARVHVFQRCDTLEMEKEDGENERGAAEDDKHLRSMLAGTLNYAYLNAHEALTPAGPNLSETITRERLEAHAPTSATARRLLGALSFFEQACKQIRSKDFAFSRIVLPLAEALSVMDGELVMTWPSAEEEIMALATILVGVIPLLTLLCDPEVGQDMQEEDFNMAMLSTLQLVQTDPEGMLLHTIMLLEDCAAYPISERSDTLKGWVAEALADQEELQETLAAAVLALCSILLSDVKVAFKIVDCACDMGLGEPSLFMLRAQLNSFLCNHLDAGGGGELDGEDQGEDQLSIRQRKAACVEDIAKDCDRVLKARHDDPQAIYVKACALRNHPDVLRHASDSMALFERFLQVAEPDDRFRPAAHYNLGMMSLLSVGAGKGKGASGEGFDFLTDLDDPEITTAFKHARQQYKLGMVAEEQRLPFFKPQGLPSKNWLGLILMHRKSTAQQESQQAAAVGKAQRQAAHFARQKEQQQAAAKRKIKRQLTHLTKQGEGRFKNVDDKLKKYILESEQSVRDALADGSEDPTAVLDLLLVSQKLLRIAKQVGRKKV